MSNIVVNEDELLEEMTGLREAAEELALPILRTTTGHTAAGLQYLPDAYNNFRDIISKYILLFKRDLGYIADTACAFYFFDSACGNVLAFDDIHSTETRWSILLDCLDDPQTVEYTVGTAAHMYPDWSFGIHDLDMMAANIIENLFELIDHTNTLIGMITSFRSTPNFSGEASEATLGYFYEIHTNVCQGIRTVAQTFFAHISHYWNSYSNSSLLTYNGDYYVFYKAKMEEFIQALDAKGDYMRRKHTYIVSSTMNLYIDSAYEYDFNDTIPGIRELSDKYNALIETTQSMIDKVDEIEDTLIADQSETERPIFELVDFINSVIANVQGRYDYIYPPTTDVIGIDGYQETFEEVREINEEEYMGDMCLAATHAGEVNTEVARDIRNSNNQVDLIVGVFAVVCGVYGIWEGAALLSGVAEGVFITGQSLPIAFQISDTIEEATEFYNLNWGDPEASGFNPLLQYYYHGDEDAYSTARSLASYGSIIANAARFTPTATMNELEYLLLLLLRKMSQDGVVNVLVNLGMTSASASALVSRAMGLCDRGYSAAISDETAISFLTIVQADTVQSLTSVSTAGTVADMLDQDIESSSYEQSSMDTNGYDEERLNDLGIVGEPA